MQRPTAEIASFAAIAGAETVLTREFGGHVFDIAELLRVSVARYNYRVWVVVCAVRCEPVSASFPLLFPVICLFQGQGPPTFAGTRLHASCFSLI